MAKMSVCVCVCLCVCVYVCVFVCMCMCVCVEGRGKQIENVSENEWIDWYSGLKLEQKYIFILFLL